MSEIAYKQIESALASLSDSTYRKIITSTCTVEANGLRNPYRSHRSRKVAEGHQKNGMVHFSNNKYDVFVFPIWDYENIKGESFHKCEIPGFLTRELFLFPAIAPEWLSDLVIVAIPDFFSGYDENGKPVFEGDAEIYFKDEIIFSNYFKCIGEIGEPVEEYVYWHGGKKQIKITGRGDDLFLGIGDFAPENWKANHNNREKINEILAPVGVGIVGERIDNRIVNGPIIETIASGKNRED